MINRANDSRKYRQSGELAVSDDVRERGGGYGPDLKLRCRYYSLSKDRKYKRVLLAGVAQTVEQLPCKQMVEGATPFTGSKIFAKL